MIFREENIIKCPHDDYRIKNLRDIHKIIKYGYAVDDRGLHCSGHVIIGTNIILSDRMIEIHTNDVLHHSSFRHGLCIGIELKKHEQHYPKKSLIQLIEELSRVNFL